MVTKPKMPIITGVGKVQINWLGIKNDYRTLVSLEDVAVVENIHDSINADITESGTK